MNQMSTLMTGFCQLFVLLPLLGAHGADAREELDGASAASLQLPQEPSVDTAAFFAALEPVRVLTLEENAEVVTVFPRMAAGRAEELLVVDEPEAQVRLYGQDGSLLTVAPTGSCYLVLGETMSANLASFTYGTRRPGGLNEGSFQWVFRKRPGRPVFPFRR